MRVHRFVIASALLAAPATGLGAVILGDGADQFAGAASKAELDGGDIVGNPSGATLKVGTVSAGGRSTVYVFKLPDLGPVASPFDTANLTFKTQNIDSNTISTTKVNTDLYGLSRRDAAAGVLPEDHFIGALDTTNATLLQDNILTPLASLANSSIDTDAGGDLALAAFLNAQYDGGVGAGQFVYLRLNVDKGTTASATGYNVYTGNVTGSEPVITYTPLPEPASMGLLAVGAAGLIRRRRLS